MEAGRAARGASSAGPSKFFRRRAPGRKGQTMPPWPRNIYQLSASRGRLETLPAPSIVPCPSRPSSRIDHWLFFRGRALPGRNLPILRNRPDRSTRSWVSRLYGLLLALRSGDGPTLRRHVQRPSLRLIHPANFSQRHLKCHENRTPSLWSVASGQRQLLIIALYEGLAPP